MDRSTALSYLSQLTDGFKGGFAPQFFSDLLKNEFKYLMSKNNSAAVCVGITNKKDAFKLFIASNNTPKSNKFAKLLGEMFGADAIVKRIRSFKMAKPPRFRPGAPHHRLLTDPHRPLVIGSEISVSGCYGSLGGFVADSEGAVEIISCQHVMADCRGHIGGFDVHQPSYKEHKEPVALTRPCFPLDENNINSGDCAYAKILQPEHTGSNVIPTGMGFKNFSMEGYSIVLKPRGFLLSADLEVFKIGKTTGLTQGRIAGYDLRMSSFFKYRKGFKRKTAQYAFHPTMWVESLDDRPFSRPGDSGALIFCNSPLPNQVYALGLVSGSLPPIDWSKETKNLTRLTWACDLPLILKESGRRWL